MYDAQLKLLEGWGGGGLRKNFLSWQRDNVWIFSGTTQSKSIS